MVSPFTDVARSYVAAGLSPIPLGPPGTKAGKAPRPDNWQEFSLRRPNPAEIDAWIAQYPNANVGLCTGNEVWNGFRLAAVDIDDEDPIVQEKIERAIGPLVSGKRGHKGATWFVLAPNEGMINTNITRRHPDPAGGKPKKKMMAELLLVSRQTAVPPSIHPDTGQPYEWLGTPLPEFPFERLPFVNPGLIIELKEIATGTDQYFNGGSVQDGPHEVDIDGLNNMVWAGVGGGGTTHDNRLRCSAHMVATGWSDEDAVARLDRAMREAYERSEAGDEPDWQAINFEHQRMVASARAKGFGDVAEKKAKGKATPTERTLSAWAAEEFSPLVFTANQFRQYKDGYWPVMRPEKIKQAMFNVGDHVKNSDVNSAVSIMEVQLDDEHFGQEAINKICLLNGTLDVESGQLLQHDPEHQVLHQLDFEWDEQAECPVYDKFIKWVFGDDEKAVAAYEEFCGLTLVDDLRYQKMMFLLGPGANGKSTLAALLTTVHNQDAVSTIPITKLDDERHLTAMVGCLVNISTEQSRINTVADAVFKQVVAGDPVSVRRLFKEVENKTILKARLLCLANELPAMNDTSHAMRRRMIILECPNIIAEDQKDPDLLLKLKAERAAILRRWVMALQNLRARGRFDEPESSLKAVDTYVKENDSVAQWVGARTMPTSQDQAKWPTLEDCYIEYSEYAKTMGYRSPFPLPVFKAKLKSVGVRLSETHMKIDETVTAIVIQVGVRLGDTAARQMAARL